jgi:predicted enzyme related to lactoylglutathione lyase
MAIDGVQLATVWVNDLDAAIGFYTEALGFEKRMDMPFGDDGRFVVVGPAGGEGAGIVLQPADESRGAGGFTGIVLSSNQVEATTQDVSDRGATVTMPAAKQEWGAWMSMISDPDGNAFVIHE